MQREKVFFCSVAALEIVTYTFSFLVSGLAAKVETRLRRNVRQELYGNIFREKLGIPGRRGYGETISLFRNECEDLVIYVMEYYRQLPTIFLSAAILAVMLYINPVFAVISIVPAFGMVFLTKYLEKHIVANREAARRSTSEITSYLENLFRNIEYFKLAADTDKLGDIFAEKCRKRARNERRDSILDKTLSVISENSAGLVMGFVLLAAIPLYRRNAFSVGEFVMFEYYYAFLSSLPNAVGRLIRRYKQFTVAVRRLETEETGGCEGRAQYSGGRLWVCVESPEMRYEIEACRGNVILIRGGNENQRSTLLQRLFQICTDDLEGIASRYVPGQPVLFNGSVEENIRFGEPYLEEKMNRVLQETDLAEDIREFENGIRKSVGKYGGTVSGGQRKRISIARALYGGADILFLDGLSEAVDRKTEEILVSSILKYPEKIIFVASDSEIMVEKASRIMNAAGFSI